MNNILMLGAQGAGKGTQSERLENRLGIPTISIGRLFRGEIEKSTGLGEAINEYLQRGDRVPDDITNQLMEGRLSEEDAANGVILDGYPRTLGQVDMLDGIFEKLGRKLTHVVYIRISDEVALERLSGRWICSNMNCESNYHVKLHPPKIKDGFCDKCGAPLIQRNDDTPEAIKRRLELYHQDTEPLISKYRERGILVEVNGELGIDDVEKEIAASLQV